MATTNVHTTLGQPITGWLSSSLWGLSTLCPEKVTPVYIFITLRNNVGFWQNWVPTVQHL